MVHIPNDGFGEFIGGSILEPLSLPEHEGEAMGVPRLSVCRQAYSAPSGSLVSPSFFFIEYSIISPMCSFCPLL